MSFKKTFALLLLSVLVAFGAAAEEKDGNGKNHPYGMDIAMGIVGVNRTEINRTDLNIVKLERSFTGIEIVPMKINAYVCPWLGNHLGIYGSIGIVPNVDVKFKEKINGVESKTINAAFDCGFEFMVGPAFGVDLGSSSVRFQIGVPFHVIVGGGVLFTESGWRNNRYEPDDVYGFNYSAYGIGLTPQFRFMANRRCSFVVGMDFVYDFVYNRTFEQKINGVTVRESDTNGADRTHRFAWTPYLGLGINFGD